MSKLPAFLFYPGDWRRDTQVQMATMETRGVWFEMLCCMWDSPDRGKLTGTISELSRMIGCSDEVFEIAINEINRLKMGDVTFDETIIIIKNRRMIKDEETRTSGARRQKNLRDKGGGDPNRWAAIRIPILQRDEYMCAYCGRKADTVDHIIPKTMGGDESENNLVACCKRCNMIKSNRTPKQANMDFWKGFDKTKLQCNSKVTPDVTPSLSVSSSSSVTSFKETTKENYSCSEPEITPVSEPQEPIFITLPLADKTDYPIGGSIIMEMEELYPAVNIKQAFRSMKGWLNAVPSRKKTKRGIKKFYTGWIERDQNSGKNPKPSLPETDDIPDEERFVHDSRDWYKPPDQKRET